MFVSDEKRGGDFYLFSVYSLGKSERETERTDCLSSCIQ